MALKKKMQEKQDKQKPKVLMLASVASMIDQFNMPNIRLMQEMGYEVHVACNFIEGNTCNKKRIRELQKTLDIMAVIWHQWDCPRNVWPAWKCIRAYRQLSVLIRKYTYMWIHCHSPIGGVLARIAAHKKKIKVIYTAHGFHIYKGAALKNWLFYYPVEMWLSRWTNVLLTVNKEDYQFAKEHFRAGFTGRIPGIGIDTKYFQEYHPQMTRQEFCTKYQIPENAKILLSVGELSVRKNHRLVISLLPELDPDVCYLICGQGKLKEKLRNFAVKLGVGRRVRFLGFQKDIREFYANADVFILPSTQEGLPVALMEAMAFGMPCIVSDIRGNRELIGSEGGIRVSYKQPEQFQAALEAVLADEGFRRRCRMHNQRKIKEFDKSIVQKRMRRIYSSMETGSSR